MTASTIDDIRSAIAERETTATALAQEFYTRIRQEDPEIGAFLTLCEERALAQAGRIDRMAAEGKPLPPLAGVPVAIKDVMVTRGVRTTAGSKILDNFVPPYDCTAVARLEAADARCKGFLMGGTAGRTTMLGEGLQHQDGHSHVLASTVPTCVSYDPAYVYELAVVVQDGMKRMYEKGEGCF